MLSEVLAAAAVGISFSNAWLCMVLSFGTRGESMRVGVRFILGRFVGLCIIGVAISAIGALTDIHPIYFVSIFGVASIVFGVLMFAGLHAGPGGAGRTLRHALGIRRGDRCGAAVAAGVKPSSAFVLGILRGATPCVKLMVLAPLLIAAGPLYALLLSFVYALASTIYPLIGFMAASTLTSLPKYERALKVAGAAIMVLAGIYVIANETLQYLAPRGD